MTTIAIILGSTRQTALGRALFNQLKQLTTTNSTTTFTFLDLADYQLPLFDEALPPMANTDRQLPTNQQQWLTDLATADGYVILTPEYNHSIPGSLKNALDYIAWETQRKPVKLVSYSDNGRGGQFGAAALVPVLQRLGMLVLPKPTPVGFVQDNLQPNGDFKSDAPQKARYTKGLQQVLAEITYYTTVLTANPFPADH
ncbi:NADPH-dependent FMN reductase [Lactiplantibacillus mudanjiangensis]|uniref:NADPH-dependent FMN reductase [Lactobacillus sp.] n=1 Tax=Lactiplantibacillus mudanjiangensis TaxID=1296538 RepID=A0A660E1H8_9LACO|nr:NADPH-dependent FMN reductase [Lactiplantibacillus mudanjiangensis]VDG22800.1 NADPH-dependent FMN reductase [Lactobacillus sp.] [Lactiplantibacillus mudanjiangensis]VDG26630.1 NADPH-dependent FMN reductase [Lactobacillus sp.] [Lactiplantibacillus mudanjiangensis]